MDLFFLRYRNDIAIKIENVLNLGTRLWKVTATDFATLDNGLVYCLHLELGS